MLVFYKVFSLLIRVFSRPLINYTKRYHATNPLKTPFIRDSFSRIGNWFHITNVKINKKYLKIQIKQSDEQAKITQQKSIELGIEFFYEVLFYFLVIGFPVYQMIRGSIDSKKGQKEMDDELSCVDKKILMIQQKVSDIKRLNELQQNFNLDKLYTESSKYIISQKLALIKDKFSEL